MGGTAGMLYRAEGKRAVVLAHGVFGNRYQLEPLCQCLAASGITCLSIDVPGHYRSYDELTLGATADSIASAIRYLRGHYSRVGVITYSLGALGALFGGLGYTEKVERQLLKQWETLTKSIEKAQKDSTALREFEQGYEKLKRLLYSALRTAITEHREPTCLVLVAAPLSMQRAIPGLSLLNKLPERMMRWAVRQLLHKPMRKLERQEGGTGRYEAPRGDGWLEAQMFHTQQPVEFLKYFVSLKNPIDFLRLLEAFAELRHKDGKIGFIEYHLRRMRKRPKLFLYGRRDLLLRPFIPGTRARLDHFYQSMGNATIKHGAYTHMVSRNPKKQTGFVAVSNEGAMKDIMLFLDKHL